MTAWICGTLLAIAAIALFVSTRSDDKCENWMGVKDLKCAADRARARIRGSAYYPAETQYLENSADMVAMATEIAEMTDEAASELGPSE